MGKPDIFLVEMTNESPGSVRGIMEVAIQALPFILALMVQPFSCVVTAPGYIFVIADSTLFASFIALP